RRPHERVPRRVELDLVDAIPESVVRPEHRRMGVRLVAPRDGLAAGDRAEAAAALLGPPAALAREPLAERAVLEEDVVALERRRLVQDLVRGHVRPQRSALRAGPQRPYRKRDRSTASASASAPASLG